MNTYQPPYTITPEILNREDVLEPYKSAIDRWVCPDVMRNQDIRKRGIF